MTGAGPHSLGSSLDDLEVVGRCPTSHHNTGLLQLWTLNLDSPRTYCHGNLIIEHVNHQVQTHGLLPVNVRVSYGKLLAISPPDLHGVSLTRAQALPNKEQEVVAVDGSV